MKFKNFDIVIVCDVIMDEHHQHYYSQEDIGTILFYGIDEGNPGASCHSAFPAKPLNYNISHYPIANESVMIMIAPKPWYHFNQEETYYYFPPIGVQNNPGSNAVPNVIDEGGKYYMGKYYQHNENIRPLRPYEGDIMLEGRYGNSIRFGSTTDPKEEFKNNWSSRGKRGNPITIIRNGQSDHVEQRAEANGQDTSPYAHITEDINGDDSSIYLCSHQQILEFERASLHDASYLVDLQETKLQTTITQPNNTMAANVTEDISLRNSSNLPAAELQKLNELNHLPGSNDRTGYYDVSPTENQIVKSTDEVTLNNESLTTNDDFNPVDLEIDVGVIDLSAAQDNTIVSGFSGQGANPMGGY